MENSENLVNIPINSVLDIKDDWSSNTTIYEKISQDAIIRLKNDKLNIVYSRTFWEHLLSFLFFVARLLFLIALFIILFWNFWLNITSSFNNIKNIVSEKPLFNQTQIIDDYLWTADELLNS